MGASPTVNFFDKSIIAFLYYFNKRILNNYCIFFVHFVKTQHLCGFHHSYFFHIFLCFSKKVVTFANRKIAKQTILLYKNYMKRKLTLLLTCLLAGISLAIAQTSRKVMGVVFSEEDNQPVIGASVLVKGTSIGTTTDLDGKFVINNVPSSSRTW